MAVGWPSEGTMDLNLVKAVYAVVTESQDTRINIYILIHGCG